MNSALAISIVAAALPLAWAECCVLSGGKCGDGTNSTRCCGYADCNIFCCACGGGCRQDKRMVSDPAGFLSLDSGAADLAATTEAFNLADVGNKGFVTLDDYLQYMKVEDDHQLWIDWFKEHDKNQDGHISADEVATQ